MKKISEKVTLRDVGDHCGVHRTTVGLALRNHPSIPEETRKRIAKAAEELGYRPDPALSSLVAYRHRKQGSQFHSTVAVVSDSDFGVKHWRTRSSIGMEQYEGLSEQASQLGYKLEEYSVGTDRSHSKRVNSILRARGINCVIITGLNNLEDPINLEWDNFSCISMSYSLPQPGMPRVTTQHRANASMTVRKMVALGYRRIGFATTLENDKRVDFAWTAGFLSACYHAKSTLSHSSIYMPSTPYPNDALDQPELIEWIRNNDIQAVICTQHHILNYLRTSGFKIPDALGYAGVAKSEGADEISGVDQNAREIGRQAMNTVASMNHSNQRGIPTFQQVHLVRGIWNEGNTLKKQPGSGNSDSLSCENSTAVDAEILRDK